MSSALNVTLYLPCSEPTQACVSVTTMLGFGSFESASRFCMAFDELRQYFRVRRRGDGHVSLATQRRLFLTRWRSLISELAAA